MASEPVLNFGSFRLDPRSRSLSRDGVPVALGDRAFDVLAMLATADGQLVTKDALLEQVWSRAAVEENNLHAQISALRKALGADAIATVPGRGYSLALRDGAAAPVAGEDDQTGPPALMVIPFACLAGSASEQAFAHAVAEELAAALVRIPSIAVIVPPCEPADARQAACRLGVRYVLHGSVRSSAGRMRVLVRLCATPSGLLLWAERFEGAAEDVFNLQDRVTARVVAAIAPRIVAAEIVHAQRRQSRRPQPYDLLLRALSQNSAWTRGGTVAAIQLLRRAIALDPGYSLAHAHLACNLWWMVAQGWLHADDPTVADMLARAQTAQSFDPDNPEVLLLASVITCTRGGNLDGGIAQVERSLVLNPNSAVAYRLLGLFRAYAGDPVAAFGSLEHASRLNPFDRGLMPNHGHYLAHFCNGDHAAVVESTSRLLLDQPNFLPALRWHAASLGLMGEVVEGRRAVERIGELSPDFSIAWARRYIEVDMNKIFKAPRVAEAFYAGLRQSGMREG